MKIKTVTKIFLVVQLCQARQITKVEGLGELGHFGIKLLQSLLPQRGQRRIEENEGSLEARFFQQQQNCPYGQCGGNSGVQLVYPNQNSNKNINQVKGNVYQTSFTSNGYNPTLDDLMAPTQAHFQPIGQGQQAPKPVLNNNKHQQTSFSLSGLSATKPVIHTPETISLGHHTSQQQSQSVVGQNKHSYQTGFKTSNHQQLSTSPKPVFSSNSNQQQNKVYNTKRADQPIEQQQIPILAPSGIKEESVCVCVPVAQCPSAAQAVFLGNKNYAGLISPRNHQGSNISSGSRRRQGGRSIKFGDSENELEKELAKDSTETPSDDETVETTTTIVASSEDTSLENVD